MKNYIIGFILGIFLIFMILALRPISISKNKSKYLVGQVETIYEDGEKDLVIKLTQDPTHYYINRGFERQFNLEGISNQLSLQQIELFYADQWTPLDPMNNNRHITQIILHGKIIYTEFK